MSSPIQADRLLTGNDSQDRKGRVWYAFNTSVFGGVRAGAGSHRKNLTATTVCKRKAPTIEQIAGALSFIVDLNQRANIQMKWM